MKQHFKILLTLFFGLGIQNCLCMNTFSKLLFSVRASEKNTKDKIYDQVKEYIDAGGDVDQQDPGFLNMALLHAATDIFNYDDPWLIDLLLNAHANPNLLDASGRSPIFYLVNKSAKATARLKRLLQESDIDLSLKHGGSTPLQLARESKNAEVIALLEEYAKKYPTSVEKKEKSEKKISMEEMEKTKLFNMFEQNIPEMLDPKKYKAKPALEKDILTNLIKFFKQGYKLSSDECFNLAEQAIVTHSLSIVKTLIEQGNCDPSHIKSEETILHMAIDAGDEPIVRYLLKKMDISAIEKHSSSLLQNAAEAYRIVKDNPRQRLEIITLLLDADADQTGFDKFIKPGSAFYSKDIATYYQEYLRTAQEWRKTGSKK